MVKSSIIAIIFSLAGTIAHAQGNVAISGGFGTTGASVEGAYKLNDYVSLRAGGSFFSYEVDTDIDDILFTGDLELSGLTVGADIHPFRNSFVVTGGALIGDKSIGLSATSQENITIGDVEFSPAQYGQLDGSVEFENFAPFLALGYDNTFQGTGLGFRAIAGLAVFGSAAVDLRSVGGILSNTPTLTAEIEREVAKIEADVEDYELFPLVQLSLTFRF